MLRDFIRVGNESDIYALLSHFKLPSKNADVQLLEFKVLTPDSFIWRLLIDKTVYYLYAEDYVEGLEYVRQRIARSTDSEELEFIEARVTTSFKDTSPVQTAVVYEEPDDSQEIMRFAVSSGHDFVFLCRSDEDSNTAFFND
jgi:hypothetical protein